MVLLLLRAYPSGVRTAIVDLHFLSELLLFLSWHSRFFLLVWQLPYPILDSQGERVYRPHPGDTSANGAHMREKQMKWFIALLGFSTLSLPTFAAGTKDENLLINGSFDAEQVSSPSSGPRPPSPRAWSINALAVLRAESRPLSCKAMERRSGRPADKARRWPAKSQETSPSANIFGNRDLA